MPLYHGTATILGLCPVMVTGATFILGHRFGTKSYWEDVRRHDASIIQYVGEACRYLLAAPPTVDPATGANLDRAHNVRMAFGNGLRPDVWDRFRERFGIETIGEFFSATESPGAWWNLSRNSFSSGAVGRTGSILTLLSKKTSTLVQIDWETETPRRDPQTQLCTRAQVNEPGELLWKVNALDMKADYQGFYNNKAASDSKIMRDVHVQGDAYFRTGDVLRLDAEGRWFFCDRIGDTFRWKSENVSTTEVSEALSLHPMVQNANVYGVEVPHHDGRIGCAAILLTGLSSYQGTHKQGGIHQEVLGDLAKHARQHLPSYAVPGFLRVVTEFATTGNHKQVKTGLKKEGIDPSQIGNDRLFWLRGDSYTAFGNQEWQDLLHGRLRI